MSHIKPYPENWHRRLDFLPLLKLQTDLGERDLGIYHCLAQVSVPGGFRIPKSVTETEFGELEFDQEVRNSMKYQMVSIDRQTNKPAPISHKEVLDDVEKYMGLSIGLKPEDDVPDMVIKKRGIGIPIPKQLEDLEVLQTSDKLFYQQEGTGNIVPKLRRITLLPLENPYRWVKAELIGSGIIHALNHPVLRKLRSTLKTQWMMTDDLGWLDLGDAGILSIEDVLTNGKWWLDIGEPTPFEIPMNSGIDGQIYHLRRRGGLVGV